MIRNGRKKTFGNIGREKKELLTSSVSPLSVSQMASQSDPFIYTALACLCEELGIYSSV